MRKIKRILILLLAMFMIWGTIPVSAAGEADLTMGYENLGDGTIKVTITAKASAVLSGTRVGLLLNNAIKSCYLNLIQDSVYVDNVRADSVNTQAKLNNTSGKYFLQSPSSTNRLWISLGDFADGDIKVVTFLATVTSDTETIALSLANLYKDNDTSAVVATSPATSSTPFIHAVKAAGIKTSVISSRTDGEYYVGDIVEYTITAANESDGANSNWKSVTVTDMLPDEVAFISDSVKIDGIAATVGTSAGHYTYNELAGTLVVYLKNIGSNSDCTVTFNVTIGNAAVGKTVTNTAQISGVDEGSPSKIASVEVSDTGFVLKQEYSAPSYTVSYDANGGTGNYADAGLLFDSGYTVLGLSDTGITRDAYTFEGWNTKADGSGDAYRKGGIVTITGDVTLYAQWKKQEVSAPNPSDDSSAPAGSNPSTGDTSNIGLWITLLFVSLLGVVCPLWTIRKKKQYESKR